MSNDYKFTLITGQGCPACNAAKERLTERINSGQIRVMDVISDDKAMELANKFNITAVPSMIIGNKTTPFSEVCELKGDLSGVICKDKEVDF